MRWRYRDKRELHPDKDAIQHVFGCFAGRTQGVRLGSEYLLFRNPLR